MSVPVAFAIKLVKAALDGHLVFYEKAVEAIAEEVRAVAVAYFARDPVSGRYVFRSCTGGDDGEALNVTTLSWSCTHLCPTGVNAEVKELTACECPFFSRSEIEKRGGRFVVCCRIPDGEDRIREMMPRVETIDDLDHLGILIAFTDSISKASSAAFFLQAIAPLFAALNIDGLHASARIFRGKIISRSLIKRDVNSFLHHAVKMASEIYPFEGASAFLWDSQRKLLKLRSTTGLVIAHPKNEVYYTCDEDRITVNVAKTGFASVTDDAQHQHCKKGKYEERVQSSRQSFACLPIYDWGHSAEPEGNRPIGILRVINKNTIVFGKKYVVPFAWDDLCMLKFVAEVLGVVTNYLRRAMDSQDNFERIIHGIKANVTAVVLNLAHFEKRPESITINNEHMRYILPDSLAMGRDVKWQIDRTVAWHKPRYDTNKPEDKIQVVPLRITGEVLAKLKGMIPEMVQVLNGGRFSCEYANYEEFIRMPEVLGDAVSLMTVFRNLAENAIKYTRPDTNDSLMRFGHRLTGDGFLDILVDDEGIGIPAGDESWIFEDGFRCDNAMRRRPGGGSGIGLPHSRYLMRLMGGDLLYERQPSGTRFVVRLKLAPGYQTGSKEKDGRP